MWAIEPAMAIMNVTCGHLGINVAAWGDACASTGHGASWLKS